MGQMPAPTYFHCLLTPCSILQIFGWVLPLCACGRTVMWGYSEFPFDRCDRSAAFYAIAVDPDLACPPARMVEGQGHSLFGKQYPMAPVNSGFRSAAGCCQKTFSTSPKFKGANDEGSFFGADFADEPSLCSIPRGYTSAPNKKNNHRGPACGHILCDVRVGYPRQSSHLEQRLCQYCRALDSRGLCKGNIAAGA